MLEKLSAGMYESLGSLVSRGIRPGASLRGEYNLLEHAVGLPQTPFFALNKRPKGLRNTGTKVLPRMALEPTQLAKMHANVERPMSMESMYFI